MAAEHVTDTDLLQNAVAVWRADNEVLMLMLIRALIGHGRVKGEEVPALALWVGQSIANGHHEQ